MHNYYTYLYNKCVFELLESEKGEGNAVLFARSATAGGQKFPVHWGGDCTSDYQSMAESLRGGLSLCMSGFSFWSHDISGFQGTASHDLYKRWVAFGLLSTHSRLHGDSSYRVPWLFSKEGEENGEEACAVTKHFSELKCSLMPYIFASAVASHKTGIPTMRPMVLEFTEDKNTHYLDKQYMLGDSIMVAPVFRENGEADYYLPKGKWTHLLTNETRLGEKWYKDTYDFFSLPLYVRENTVLPIGGCSTRPDYSYQDGVTLHIFELNTEAKAVIYDEKGKNPANVSVIRKENKITVKIDKHLKNVKILLRNIPYITSVSCNEAESVSLGTLIPISEKETVITL